jgi:hypothetical protein
LRKPTTPQAAQAQVAAAVRGNDNESLCCNLLEESLVGDAVAAITTLEKHNREVYAFFGCAYKKSHISTLDGTDTAFELNSKIPHAVLLRGGEQRESKHCCAQRKESYLLA